MARRTILTGQNIGVRRRPRNKLGFALQLCVLRYPVGLFQPSAASGSFRDALRAFVSVTTVSPTRPGSRDDGPSDG